MAGRALPSFLLVALLAAGSSAARAEGENIAVGEPSGQAQAEAPAAPKLLGYGKGEDGTHAFLFARPNASPVVFLGQPGDLKELDVLGIERYSGKFVVDTLELGEIQFHTTDKAVIIPGEIGFNSKRPTRVMRGKPDQAVFVEAMARMGFVRKAPSPAQAAIQSALTRVVARSRQLSGTGDKGRLGVFQNAGAKATMRARATRRPVGKARITARGRQTVRTSARVQAR